jgi:hypothetical protein
MFDRDAGPCSAGFGGAWRTALSFIQRRRYYQGRDEPESVYPGLPPGMSRRSPVRASGATRSPHLPTI